MHVCMQEGLQAVCQGVVQDLDGDSQDASTSAGSMSGTTMPAASRGGPAVACRYLLQLGKARWGWQDNPGRKPKEFSAMAFDEVQQEWWHSRAISTSG